MLWQAVMLTLDLDLSPLILYVQVFLSIGLSFIKELGLSQRKHKVNVLSRCPLKDWWPRSAETPHSDTRSNGSIIFLFLFVLLGTGHCFLPEALSQLLDTTLWFSLSSNYFSSVFFMANPPLSAPNLEGAPSICSFPSPVKHFPQMATLCCCFQPPLVCGLLCRLPAHTFSLNVTSLWGSSNLISRTESSIIP